MSAVTGKSIDSIVSDYAGKGLRRLQGDVAEAVVECLKPIRARYDELSGDKAYLEGIISRARSARRGLRRKLFARYIKKLVLYSDSGGGCRLHKVWSAARKNGGLPLHSP